MLIKGRRSKSYASSYQHTSRMAGEGCMKISVLTGGEASRWLKDETSQAKWKRLYEQCPWSTVCQSASFVRTWYDAYQSQWEPVIVAGTRADGDLVGLLTLAVA